MADFDHFAGLSRHYAKPDLGQSIIEVLKRAGKDVERLSIDDLAPVDQFHTRGKASTLELAQLAAITSADKVLDVGGSLGGSARMLAAQFGCHVTVLDLIPEYCRAGEMLTELTKQSDKVVFRIGNATEVSFDDATFDVVWMQHVNMNIENKERLYREAHRVLKRGGRLAMHEVVAGTNQPIHFPVPWASEAATSFLCDSVAIRNYVDQAGFKQESFRDSSAVALAWFKERIASLEGKPIPPLSLQLLLGDAFLPGLRNMARNLEEDRIAIVEAVYETAKRL